jgi:hypothetical protein
VEGPLFKELGSASWLVEESVVKDVPENTPRIVILVAEEDAITADFLTALSKYGYAVGVGVIGPKTDLKRVFTRVRDAEIVIALTSTSDIDVTDFAVSLRTIAQYLAPLQGTQKYGVRMGGPKLDLDEFPVIVEIDRVFTLEDVERLAARVANYFAAQEAGGAIRSEERKERQDRIEKNAATYIQEALAALQEREQRWKTIAHLAHMVGFLTLLTGVGAVLWFSNHALATVSGAVQWPTTVYVGIKSVIVVALLAAASKYAFTIGKSYMNEALKNADRIHAINFGTFYLNAYGDKATWIELKEVFQHWNIARDSGFATLDSSQFDPQLLSSAVEIAKSLTLGSKK